MTTAEIVSERQSSTGARQAKVKRTADDGSVSWWVVSSIVAMDTGKFETLAFDGHESGWNFGSARAGGIGQHREDLIKALSDPNFQPSDGPCNVDELDDELGGVLGVALSTLGLLAQRDSLCDDSDDV